MSDIQEWTEYQDWMKRRIVEATGTEEFGVEFPTKETEWQPLRQHFYYLRSFDDIEPPVAVNIVPIGDGYEGRFLFPTIKNKWTPYLGWFQGMAKVHAMKECQEVGFPKDAGFLWKDSISFKK